MLDFFESHRGRLDCGARFIITPMPGRRQATACLYFRTGSRFESAQHSGLSHFLEHMLFRGTPRYPSSLALARGFEDLGGTLEASTSADHGELSIVIPKESLRPVLDLLSEVFREPLLLDLETERSIIREEILEDFDDAGQLIDPASVLRRLAFGDSGLGQLITGPVENLDRFDEAMLRAHHARTHVAGSLVISVAGDVDVSATEAWIRADFSAIDRGQQLVGQEPPGQDSPRIAVVDHAGSSQTAICLGFRGEGHGHAIDAATEILLRVIDDGMATRLYQRLCDKSGLCYDVSATYEAYDEVGLIEFAASTAHHTGDRVVRELLSLTGELTEHAVPGAELDRVRRRLRWQYESLADHPSEVADLLGLTSLQGSPEPVQRLEALLSVSSQEVLSAAQRLFAPERRNLVAIGAPGRQVRAQLEKWALSEASP